MKKNVTKQQDETVTTSIVAKQEQSNETAQSEIVNTPEPAQKTKPKFFTAGNMAVMGILTAISYILYLLPKLIPIFNFPIFPGWLEFQVSDLPALLGGFAIGPWEAVIIVVIKCLLKMPLTSTACVGELADIIMGIAFTVPASIMYQRFKNRKGAIAGMGIGVASSTVMSMLANWLILVPFYATTMFGDIGYDAGLAILTDALQSTIYPWVTTESFYVNYIFVGVLPFNLLRLIVCAVISYFVYKPLSKALHWEIKTKKQKLAEQQVSENAEEQLDNSVDNVSVEENK
ncbi:MAG: ECF transporter S component [Clostridia bacterium]|nr:ECF transporter S component [Clostridia bacterium]